MKEISTEEIYGRYYILNKEYNNGNDAYTIAVFFNKKEAIKQAREFFKLLSPEEVGEGYSVTLVYHGAKKMEYPFTYIGDDYWRTAPVYYEIVEKE